MTSQEYSEKLKDPRWQKKRLEILERDGWKCKACYETERPLNVHHLFYFPNKDPWDIHSGFLITLCEDCHLEQKECTSRVIDEVGLLLDQFWKSGFDACTDLIDIAYVLSETKRPSGRIKIDIYANGVKING